MNVHFSIKCLFMKCFVQFSASLLLIDLLNSESLLKKNHKAEDFQGF